MPRGVAAAAPAVPAGGYVDPCNGQFKHEQSKGCCPIEVSINNAKITKGVRASTDLGVLPDTFIDVLSSGDAAYLRQIDHTADLSFDTINSTHKELMEAVTDGRVTVDTAIGVFIIRLTEAVNADERSEIRDYMSGLKEYRTIKGVSKARESDVKGNLLYLWAAVAKNVQNLGGAVASTDGASLIADIEKLLTAESESVQRAVPRLSITRLNTESKFDAALMQWSLMTHLVGVMNTAIQAKFLWSVAYITRHHSDMDFWATQEYFIACLDLLDRKICTVENVADKDRNVMISTAIRLGCVQSGAALGSNKSTSDAAAVVTVKKTWNGSFKPNTASNAKVKPCPVFNGRPGGVHNAGILDKNGACVFRHVCNAWVDDKGSGGMCERDHGRVSGPCDNARKCAACLP